MAKKRGVALAGEATCPQVADLAGTEVGDDDPTAEIPVGTQGRSVLRPDGVITQQQPGLLGIGQQRGRLTADNIDQRLWVIEGIAEPGPAHRRAIKTAPVQVGQRLRVPGLMQVRRGPGRHQLIELTIERDVR